MICKNCGISIEDGSAFCYNCGTATNVTPQAEPVAQPVAQPAQPYTQPAQPYTQPAQPYTQPVQNYSQPVQNYSQPVSNIPQNTLAYQNAKDYMAGAKTAKILSIVTVSLFAANWALGLGSIIPFLGLILVFLWILVAFFGSPAAFICAIISSVKLGKINKIEEVVQGSVDPQTFADYTKAKGGAKAAKIINTIYFVLTLVPLVLTILGAGIILIITIFDGGDLIEEILWILEDIIEEGIYIIEDIVEEIFYMF